MRNLFLMALGLIILLIACKNPVTEKKSVKIVKEIKDGFVTEYEFDSIKNVKSGYFKKFYPDGKLFIEMTYVNDSVNGVEKVYYENGKLKEEFTHKMGKYDGPFKYYFEDGKIMQEGMHVNNFIKGDLKSFYPNGQIKEIVMFEENEENGPFVEYYENGKIKAKGNYFKGPNSENCLLMEYDENGELISKKTCKRGQCCTIWTKEKGDIKPDNPICIEIIKEMETECKSE